LRYDGNQKRKEVIMSMKKLISFALCLTLALAFAGCKPKEEAPKPAEAPKAEAPAAQKPMSSAQAPAAPAAPAAEKH
jgi:hypothetical protein